MQNLFTNNLLKFLFVDSFRNRHFFLPDLRLSPVQPFYTGSFFRYFILLNIRCRNPVFFVNIIHCIIALKKVYCFR